MQEIISRTWSKLSPLFFGVDFYAMDGDKNTPLAGSLCKKYKRKREAYYLGENDCYGFPCGVTWCMIIHLKINFKWKQQQQQEPNRKKNSRFLP
jgi:hypothetical protein